MSPHCKCSRGCENPVFNPTTDCWVCWLWFHSPKHKEAFAEFSTAADVPKDERYRRGQELLEKYNPCPHRLGRTGKRKKCGSGCTYREGDEFVCDLHGLCVIDVRGAGITCCTECPNNPRRSA